MNFFHHCRKLILEKTEGGIIETEQRLTAEISNAKMKISMIDEELKSFPSGNSGDFANDENLIEELRQKISEFAVISKDDDATNFSLDALEKKILDLEEKFQLSSTKEANLDQEMEELVNEEKVLQREIPILEKSLGKKNALMIYDQFTLNHTISQRVMFSSTLSVYKIGVQKITKSYVIFLAGPFISFNDTAGGEFALS